jgi:hypothetical protein
LALADFPQLGGQSGRILVPWGAALIGDYWEELAVRPFAHYDQVGMLTMGGDVETHDSWVE